MKSVPSDVVENVIDRLHRPPGWTPVVVAVILLVGSVVPLPSTGGSGPPLLPSPTAIGHLVGYATLAYTLRGRLRSRPARSAVWISIAVLAAVVSYGALVEVLQWFIPYRHFDLADVTVNALGALAGLGAWWLTGALQG